MSRFNVTMNDSREEVIKIRAMQAERAEYGNVTMAEIDNEYTILYEKMEEGSEELYDAFLVSYLSLLFPIKMMLYNYFLKATKRTTNLMNDLTHIIELTLFLAEFIWIFDYKRLAVYDPTNIWAEGDEGDHKNLMLNVMWY